MARPEPSWMPLPRDGVNASRVVVGAQQPDTVGAFLQARFPAVADWPARLARGDVLGQLGQPLSSASPSPQGTLIWYWRQPAAEQRVPVEIELLYQDENLLVVDKPHFLPVIPGGRHLQETVLVRLTRQFNLASLAPLHRLDRDTAGVLVFSVRPATRAAYHGLFRDRLVQKIYETVAPWQPDMTTPRTLSHRLAKSKGSDFMQVQVVQGPPNAHTRMNSASRLPPPQALPQAFAFAWQQTPHWALYELQPLTGHTHQLRVQMSNIGLPILGDRIYPVLQPDTATDHSAPLQLLARSLAFTDPFTGQKHAFTSRRQLMTASEQRTSATQNDE